MIQTFTIDHAAATTEFGTLTQRLIPWAGQADQPPFGQMALFLDAHAETEPDCHDQDEFVIVLCGRAEVRMDGESVRISRGEMAFLPRNHRHVIVNPGDDRLVWLSIYWPLHEPTGGEREGE